MNRECFRIRFWRYGSWFRFQHIPHPVFCGIAGWPIRGRRLFGVRSSPFRWSSFPLQGLSSAPMHKVRVHSLRHVSFDRKGVLESVLTVLPLQRPYTGGGAGSTASLGTPSVSSSENSSSSLRRMTCISSSGATAAFDVARLIGYCGGRNIYMQSRTAA
jgi:hypothetical protein